MTIQIVRARTAFGASGLDAATSVEHERAAARAAGYAAGWSAGAQAAQAAAAAGRVRPPSARPTPRQAAATARLSSVMEALSPRPPHRPAPPASRPGTT